MYRLTYINVLGSDFMLIKVAEAVLKKAGWPKSVLSGQYTFEVAKHTRNVKHTADEEEH